MRITIETEMLVASATITNEQLAAINKIISPEPKEYKIFFAQGPDQFTEKVSQYREYAGSVLAKNLDEAFAKSQNGNDKEWESLSRRSTSVGDFISDGQNMYMVASQGFTLVCSVLVDNTFDIVNLMNEQLAHEELQIFNEEVMIHHMSDINDDIETEEEEIKWSQQMLDQLK